MNFFWKALILGSFLVYAAKCKYIFSSLIYFLPIHLYLIQLKKIYIIIIIIKAVSKLILKKYKKINISFNWIGQDAVADETVIEDTPTRKMRNGTKLVALVSNIMLKPNALIHL